MMDSQAIAKNIEGGTADDIGVSSPNTGSSGRIFHGLIHATERLVIIPRGRAFGD
jgi:hypothetical protein